jgi:hypothetical protein
VFQIHVLIFANLKMVRREGRRSPIPEVYYTKETKISVHLGINKTERVLSS